MTTIQAIPYKGELFEDIGPMDYSKWEDALDGIAGNTKAERDASYDWITYDFLTDLGYFVQTPDVERPVFDPAKSPIPAIPDEMPTHVTRREPAWTPSRVMNERAKVLREQAALLKAKERELQAREKRAKQAEAAGPLHNPNEFYNADGTPYNGTNYATAFITLVILFIVIYECAVVRAR